MGATCDVFVAGAAELDGSDLLLGPPAAAETVRCAGLDPVKLQYLADALGLDGQHAVGQPVAIGAEGVPVVVPLAREVAGRLADLDAVTIGRLADRWAGGPVALAGGDWGEEAVLAELARLARGLPAAASIYLWWSP